MDFAVVFHPGKGLESLRETEKDSVLHVTENLLCKNLEGTTAILTAGIWEHLYSWTLTGRLLRFARALAWVAMILHWFYRKAGFPWKKWSTNHSIALWVSEYPYLLPCNSGGSWGVSPLCSSALPFSWKESAHSCLLVVLFVLRFLGQGTCHYPLPYPSARGCFGVSSQISGSRCKLLFIAFSFCMWVFSLSCFSFLKEASWFEKRFSFS